MGIEFEQYLSKLYLYFFGFMKFWDLNMRKAIDSTFHYIKTQSSIQKNVLKFLNVKKNELALSSSCIIFYGDLRIYFFHKDSRFSSSLDAGHNASLTIVFGGFLHSYENSSAQQSLIR